MKHSLLITLVLILCATAAPPSIVPSMNAHAQQPPANTAKAPPASTNYKGVNRLLPTEDLMTGRRRFEAGAHTAWHIHPGGQLLHMEEGVGVVQRRGEPLKVLRKGETDFTPAGVPHWHGAAPDMHAVMAMVHFGGIGPWLEPVTDADYATQTKPSASASQRPPSGASTSKVASEAERYVGKSSTLPSTDMQAARGRFEAGAHTNWHVHPSGQVILAEEGPVFIQRRGEPLKMLRKGESDFTPPGIAHWHGAAPDSHAQKVVVGFGAPTNWLDPVSDADYAQTRSFKR